MKKMILTVVACLVSGLAAHSQGYVQFANIGAGVNSPFRDEAGALLTGTSWMVELLAGPTSGGAMTSVTPLFTGAFSAGYFNGGARNITGVTGTSAFAVVRVWDSVGGTITSYANATRKVSSNPAGFAITLQPSQTLPPAVMNNMPALTIPEPSTYALLALGAGALLFRRRK